MAPHDPHYRGRHVGNGRRALHATCDLAPHVCVGEWEFVTLPSTVAPPLAAEDAWWPEYLFVAVGRWRLVLGAVAFVGHSEVPNGVLSWQVPEQRVVLPTSQPLAADAAFTVYRDARALAAQVAPPGAACVAPLARSAPPHAAAC